MKSSRLTLFRATTTGCLLCQSLLARPRQQPRLQRRHRKPKRKSNFRGHTLKAIVLIKSCHRHAERRAACLATWLPYLDWADYTFLVGQPTPAQGVPVEFATIACNVSDEFPNIAPKVRCGFSFA